MENFFATKQTPNSPLFPPTYVSVHNFVTSDTTNEQSLIQSYIQNANLKQNSLPRFCIRGNVLDMGSFGNATHVPPIDYLTPHLS
jgi:hypothetical protein